MKQFSMFFNSVLTGILAFILLSFGLPAIHAQAAGPTPTTSPTPTVQTISPPKPVCDATRSVQVSGTAVINVTPDRALIQLGVQSNGMTPDGVEALNAASIQKVINAVRTLGVDPKDIATDWYIIEPIYDDYDSLYIKGYRIHNVVAITLRDVSKVSKVIAVALQTGANQVVNVDLYTSELRKYRDQARDLAMKAAKEKAQALASTAGTEAGCVLTINENSWSYYNGGGWWYGSGQSQNQWTQNVVQNAAPSGGSNSSGADEEPISLGQISVKAEVSASFGLK